MLPFMPEMLKSYCESYICDCSPCHQVIGSTSFGSHFLVVSTSLCQNSRCLPTEKGQGPQISSMSHLYIGGTG